MVTIASKIKLTKISDTLEIFNRFLHDRNRRRRRVDC